MTKRGFIMMTALPPTRGHAYLIEWARNYCLYSGIRHLTVMVCGQPHEPLNVHIRCQIFQHHFSGLGNGVLLDFVPFDRAMPQEPEDHPNFWIKWCKAVDLHSRVRKGDVVFASERYGPMLASELRCSFVPCNTYRETVQVSGSQVRDNPLKRFDMILPSGQGLFRKTVTIFGPESTGKTTLAKKLANTYGHYVPEWAREYLELQDDHSTDEAKMQQIVYGQLAVQETVHKFVDKPFVFQDTDLLSTIGFYRMYGWDPKPAEDHFIKADHYLLMKDNVPFTPDILRYGVDKREQDFIWWYDILMRYGIKDENITLIDSPTWIGRTKQAFDAVEKVFMEHPLWHYKRHKQGAN